MIEQEVEEIMDDEEEIRKKYFLAINKDEVEEISKHLANRICNRFINAELGGKPPREFISSTNFYQEYFMLIMQMTPNGFLNYQISRVYRKDGKIENLLAVPLCSTYNIFDILNRRAMKLKVFIRGDDPAAMKDIQIQYGYQMPKIKDILNICDVFYMLSMGNLDKKLEETLTKESHRFASEKNYPYTKIRVIPNVMHWKVKWMTQHIVESIMNIAQINSNFFFEYLKAMGHIEARLTPTELGTVALLPIVIEHYKYEKDIINESC